VARRARIDLRLDRFDELARHAPVLANIRPAGEFLMEDFFYAGGLPAMLAELAELIDGTQMTVNGLTLGENIRGARNYNDNVIRGRSNPLIDRNGLAVLHGNRSQHFVLAIARDQSPQNVVNGIEGCRGSWSEGL
jgi:dihydroxy-acid dehydratase